jgi:hypothetical protein
LHPEPAQLIEARAGVGAKPDQLAFSIGFAVSCSRALLRRLLKEHVTDNARQVLTERVIEHLELSGFEIDEAEQVMGKRPPTGNHG